MTLQITQYVVTAVALTVFGVLLLLLAAPWLYGKLRRCGLFFVFIAAGFLYSMATKPPTVRVYYDGGIKPGATPNVVTNDTVSIHWQRDTSGGVYVPESAAVYIDYRPNTATNEEWGLLAQTTVGAWGWSGSVENATNYDYNVWAYYIPPEPVHTNGVWTYKTHFDRNGEYALPLRARVEVNGVAIATPAEKRKDAERVTAKSYIQDGLIAMWDGIENAGWGVHDASARTWKDLVGNNDWTNSGATVLNDGFNTKTGLLIKDMASPFPTTLKGVNSHTLEIVCSTTKDREITIISPLSDNSLGFYKRVYRNSFYPYITSSGYSYCDPSSYTLGQMRHFAITYTTYNRGQVTIDGDITVPISVVSRSVSYGSKMSIGGVFGQSGADFTINAIRYYSKIMSASEIRHNYKIDKERFNLP